MKESKIHTRSLVVGAILGMIIAVTVGATLKNRGVVGRFELNVGAGPAFVIDTESGQVWMQNNNNQGPFFEPKAK